MYQVYGMAKTRSTRVVWTLEELGLEYRFHPVNLIKGEGQSLEFLKLNPSGKVPVLVDGELVLSESAAICNYLVDKHPESGLAPRPGSGERGQYDQWCFFVLCELEQPLWTMGKHQFVFPEEKRVPAILEVALWEFQRAAAVLAGHLKGREFLVADRFSVADIHAAHTLLWAKGFKQPHGQEILDDYMARVSSREAFARAREREATGQ